ncbi:DUF3491 domain-containing protein [Citrobacter braakii]|uniref:DUF3491 domain-containing protein n=1 Tax=Citrobacter braakii TaxID=57706 RepID=UPI00351D701B
MTSAWSGHDRRVMSEVSPSFMYKLRNLAEKKSPTLSDISRLDGLMTQMLAKFTGDNAKASVQSIRESMFRHFKTFSVPVAKQTHLILNGSPEMALTLPLHSLGLGLDSLTLWTEPQQNHEKALDLLLSRTVRRLMIDDKIGSILSFDRPPSGPGEPGLEHLPLLETYKNLIVQSNPSPEDIRLTMQQIEQDPVLRQFIRSVQASTPLQVQKLLMKKETEWGALTSAEQQLAFQTYFDRFGNEDISHQARTCLHYLSAPEIQLSGLPGPVIQRNLNAFFASSSLYHLLNRHHYNFPDRGSLVSYLLLLDGQQGLFTRKLSPVLSGEVTDLLEDHLDAQNARSPGIRQAILQAMETHLLQPQVPLTLEGLEALSQISPESRQILTLFLEQLPAERWFQPLDWTTPLLGPGIRFSADGQHLTDTAIMAGEGALRASTRNFGFYLDALYYFHRRALEDNLTPERVQQKLLSLDMASQYTPERVADFVSQMKKKPYQSLTAIHRLLSGAPAATLSMAALSWGVSHYPMISGNLVKFRPDGTPDISPSMVMPEHLPALPGTSAGTERHSLLSWLDVYSTHISLWDDVTHRWQAASTEFHPQSLLTDGDGLCMGISLAMLQADTAESWKILQQNLATAGALRLRHEVDGLPLSEADRRFLTAVKDTVLWLQKAGNHQLRQQVASDDIRTLSFTTPAALTELITRHDLKQVLLTTEKHSLILQKQGIQWRVSDPSLGSALFSSLDNAAEFLLQSVRLTPALQQLYGTTGESPVLNAYYSNGASSESWRHFISPPDGHADGAATSEDTGIFTTPYRTTYEVLKDTQTVLEISNQRITLAEAYELGFEYQGQMLDRPHPRFSQDELRINGHILKQYLARNALSPEQAMTIRALVDAVGMTPGTPVPSGDDIRSTGLNMVSLHHRLQNAQQHSENVAVGWMQALKHTLGLSEHALHQGRYSVHNIVLDKVLGHLTFEFDDGSRMHPVSLPVDGYLKHLSHLQSVAGGTHFSRNGQTGTGLAETGVLDTDIGMAVLGLIQTARVLQSEGKVDSLSEASMVLSGKQTLEATVGNLLMAATGQALSEEGLVTFRTERQIAGLLRRAGARIGGTLGEGLAKLSGVLELPVLDIGILSGSLISSAAELSLAKTCEEKGMLAARVAFNSITLSMSTASLVVPELAVPVMVVGALGLGVESIARNLGAAHDRYYTWSNHRDFMVSNENQVMLVSPERGLLDFSGNQICGGINLNLSTSPPVVSGHPSYDSHEVYGHMPDKTPAQIREQIGYGYPSLTTPLPDLGRRRWPAAMPVIPAGNYDVVVLGYGRTMTLSTSQEYISDWLMYDSVNNRASGGYWEVMKSPPKIRHTAMTVTGGDRMLTVVAPDAGSEHQDYTFTLAGGPGGLCAQPAGLGIYDIAGDPGSNRNVLLLTEKPMGSERDYLSFYQVDLMKVGWQDIFVNKGDGPSVRIPYPDKRLRVRLKNINQLICHGESTVCDFRGNEASNIFFANMGKISSGPGGHNQYHINMKEGRYPVSYRNGYPAGLYEHSASVGLAGVHLVLEGGAHSHRIVLDSPLGDLMAPARDCVALRDDAPRQAPHTPVDFLNAPDAVTRRITFRFADNAGGHLSLQTSDGGLLTWHGEKGWRLSQVNLSVWQQQHPDDTAMPEAVIHACRSLTWPQMEETVTLVADDYHVSYDSGAGSFTYILQKDNVRLSLPQQSSATVFGTRGSHYIIPSAAGNSLSVFMVNDPASPEVIELQGSGAPVQGQSHPPQMVLNQVNRTLTLGISSDSLFTDFTDSTSSIIFPDGRRMSLARLYGKLSQSTYPVVLSEGGGKVA